MWLNAIPGPNSKAASAPADRQLSRRREFADAIAGDHGARRPDRAERCPRRQGLRAAQDLPGEVGEQVCRSGFP
jgi:hypothetical protein